MDGEFWNWDELPGIGVYTKSHHAWRMTIRKWMNEKIIPNIDEWEESGDLPSYLAQEAYEAGVYGAGYPKVHARCTASIAMLIIMESYSDFSDASWFVSGLRWTGA